MARMTPFSQVAADAWEIECDILAITTNGTVTKNGTNVMGGGIAAEAASRYPMLPLRYGGMIEAFGHHVYVVGCFGGEPHNPRAFRPLLMFPTKRVVSEFANLSLIEQSARETITLADIYGWRAIALPRPGAGLGGLDWQSEVEPLLAELLDERFIVVSYPAAGRLL